MSHVLPHLFNISFVCGFLMFIASGFLLFDGVRKSISDAEKEKNTNERISKMETTKQDAPPPLQSRLRDFLMAEIPFCLEGTQTEFDLDLSYQQISKLEGFIEEDTDGSLVTLRQTQRHNHFIGTGSNGESYRSFAFSITPELKNP